MSGKNNKNSGSVKDQMAQLETALAWFDSEEFNLDEAFDRYEEAAKLSNDLEKTLTEMKNKVEVLSSLHRN